MRRTVIALLLLVSGAATAVAQPAKQNPPVEAPHTGHCAVGVVSHLGEKLSTSKLNFIGKSITEDVPIGSWRLDDLVVDRIRAALGKRAAVQRIPFRKEEIAPFETGSSANWGEYLFRQGFADHVRRLTAGTRCARYVIVTPGHDIDYGYGLGINRPLGAHTFVNAAISVRVYDGETARLRLATSQFGTRLVDESLWPVPPNSAAQNAKLREAIRELVARKLDAMLLKLLPTL